MKVKIQIKTILGKLLFELEKEDNTLRQTLIEAVNAKADLSGAYLSGAYLRDADLRDADLRDADLRDADLSGADLSGADLSGADLRDADLRDADLRDADLSGADLSGADLSGADLSGADLRDADLRDADLRDADLRDADLRDADLSGALNIDKVKEDFISILDSAPSEVDGLLKKLRAGEINGSTYEGDCCCLVGTIAVVKGCNYNKIPGIEPNSSRPAERFFLSIRKGHTPGNSKKCKEIEGWILEWIELHNTVKV
jgi:hypothetical protein